MPRIGNFEVKIGCDPEFFLSKDGDLVSAYGMIEGTKKEPLKVDKGAVQVDGMALEFNIDPASNPEEFVDNIDSVIATLAEMTKGYDFVMEPVARFGSEMIESQPTEAKILGCEPDFNAYTNKPNPVPNAETPFRTASGHIHISWKDVENENWPDEINPFDPTHMEACCLLAKTLDIELGIPSITFDDEVDRRSLYGAPGSFRPKCYGNGWLGMEYRTLSNKWLNFPSAKYMMFGNTVEAFTKLMSNYKYPNELFYGKTAKFLIETANLKETQNLVYRIAKQERIKFPRYYRENFLEKKAA